MASHTLLLKYRYLFRDGIRNILLCFYRKKNNLSFCDNFRIIWSGFQKELLASI